MTINEFRDILSESIKSGKFMNIHIIKDDYEFQARIYQHGELECHAHFKSSRRVDLKRIIDLLY